MPFKRRQPAAAGGLPEMFREMEDRMRRLWQEFPLAGGPEVSGEWMPRVDVSETDEEVRVRAELPGLEPEDLDISLDQDRLILKGEKKAEREKEEKGFHMVERSFGSFYRTIQLPVEVNPQRVEASFKNGVLKINMAKQEEAKKRVTHIKVD
jgi:HSP20 family protein